MDVQSYVLVGKCVKHTDGHAGKGRHFKFHGGQAENLRTYILSVWTSGTCSGEVRVLRPTVACGTGPIHQDREDVLQIADQLLARNVPCTPTNVSAQLKRLIEPKHIAAILRQRRRQFGRNTSQWLASIPEFEAWAVASSNDYEADLRVARYEIRPEVRWVLLVRPFWEKLPELLPEPLLDVAIRWRRSFWPHILAMWPGNEDNSDPVRSRRNRNSGTAQARGAQRRRRSRAARGRGIGVFLHFVSESMLPTMLSFHLFCRRRMTEHWPDPQFANYFFQRYIKEELFQEQPLYTASWHCGVAGRSLPGLPSSQQTAEQAWRCLKRHLAPQQVRTHMDLIQALRRTARIWSQPLTDELAKCDKGVRTGAQNLVSDFDGNSWRASFATTTDAGISIQRLDMANKTFLAMAVGKPVAAQLLLHKWQAEGFVLEVWIRFCLVAIPHAEPRQPHCPRVDNDSEEEAEPPARRRRIIDLDLGENQPAAEELLQELPRASKRVRFNSPLAGRPRPGAAVSLASLLRLTCKRKSRDVECQHVWACVQAAADTDKKEASCLYA
ncbi:elf1 [Symbiodinium microadriaticum]|nr:elf1 [Symbiodinium microadriaticum]